MCKTLNPRQIKHQLRQCRGFISVLIKTTNILGDGLLLFYNWWHFLAEASWVAVVTLKGLVAVMSVQQKVGSSSPTSTPVSSRPASVEKVDFYTVIPHMSSPKCATGTGNFSGRLLVCGGYDRGECLRTVEEYNPETNTWIEQPPMRHARGRFDLTVLSGKAYAIGGCDGSRELNTVEVLEVNSKKWSSVANLPLARSNTGETT